MELLRSFEAEVVQLRGLSHELMRELRAGNRQVEMAKMAESMAADENRRLNELVRKQNGTISSTQKVGRCVLLSCHHLSSHMIPTPDDNPSSI